VKQGERRRSGRKNLACDLEHLPAAAALAVNLEQVDYVQVLCGSLDNLSSAFARMDIERSAARLQKVSGSDPINPGGRNPIATTSFPREDRPLVRSKELQACITAAALSRAPRVALSSNR